VEQAREVFAKSNEARRDDTRHALGRFLLEQGHTMGRLPARRVDAMKQLNEAIDIWTELRTRWKEVAKYREYQAVAYRVLGELHVSDGKTDLAATALTKSRTEVEWLVNKDSTLPDRLADLGRTCAALGRLALAMGQPTQASDWFAKARRAFTQALQLAPEAELYRRDIAELPAAAAGSHGLSK